MYLHTVYVYTYTCTQYSAMSTATLTSIVSVNYQQVKLILWRQYMRNHTVEIFFLLITQFSLCKVVCSTFRRIYGQNKEVYAKFESKQYENVSWTLFFTMSQMTETRKFK